LTCGAIVATILLTLAVDRSLGAFMRQEYDLAFPRHSFVAYATPEFQVKARINNLGFRGREFSIPRQTRYRIVTLGDSFTFGWGVDFEDTWPRILEEGLQKRGVDVEVANLGQPGAGPAQYAQVAQRALPLLRPDLVIVALNQADDLAQTIRAGTSGGEPQSEGVPSSALTSGLKATFPNLVELRRKLRAGLAGENEVTQSWKREVADLIGGLTAEERRRFDRMDGEVKGMFVAGDLNPYLLLAGLRRPDEMQKTLELEDPKVSEAIQEISTQLRRIKGSAAAAGGQVIVVSLPNGFFVSRAMLRSYARMGFVVDEANLSTTRMDEASRRAASAAGLAAFDVTEVFRQTAASRSLFFEHDGHFNPDGQRLFAESVETFVRGELTALPGPAGRPSSDSGRPLAE
jgi:lysophospholipase L1-like esterase